MENEADFNKLIGYIDTLICIYGYDNFWKAAGMTDFLEADNPGRREQIKAAYMAQQKRIDDLLNTPLSKY